MEKSVGDNKKDAVFLHLFCVRACLENHSCNLHTPLCGILSEFGYRSLLQLRGEKLLLKKDYI